MTFLTCHKGHHHKHLCAQNTHFLHKKKVIRRKADHLFHICNGSLVLLQCSLDLNNLVSLNDVSNFNVVVAVDVQTAIVTAVNLLNIVLEALQ